MCSSSKECQSLLFLSTPNNPRLTHFGFYTCLEALPKHFLNIPIIHQLHFQCLFIEAHFYPDCVCFKQKSLSLVLFKSMVQSSEIHVAISIVKKNSIPIQSAWHVAHRVCIHPARSPSHNKPTLHATSRQKPK